MIGLMPFDVKTIGADFVSADGHKWMLGPEGAGIFYCRKDLCEKLHPAVVGWLNMVDAHNYGDYRFEFEPSARRFEPGSHNLPGMQAMDASLTLLREVGLAAVWSRVESLMAQLDKGLRQHDYKVHSPREHEHERSGIIIFTPPESKPSPDQIVAMLQKKGIILVVREGKLRASPHFYNSAKQVERLLATLP
jgi:selenocysteine lyase/cysteine desulfurase